MKKIYTIRSPIEQQKHLWDRHSIRGEVTACAYRSIVPFFLNHLRKNELILEAGCGLGAWVIFLSERGYLIEGVDNNAAVIEKLKAWDPDLKVLHGDVLRLPYPDGTVGACVSLGVVEHFENGAGPALREAFRVLKPGGMLFLTVPANNSFRRLFAHPLRRLYLLYHKMLGAGVHFAEYRYSRQEVCRLVKAAGFMVMATGIDDFTSADKSLTLWSELPFLRDRQNIYSLNHAGKCAARFFNAISRNILASGVFILARKPEAVK